MAGVVATRYPVRIPVPGKSWEVEPVEALIKGGLESVPEKYIRPIDDRPYIPQNLSVNNIPVIDLSGLDGDHPEDIMARIALACEEWGFFQIVNHGVSQSLMERMMGVSKEFIALPVEEKAIYTGIPGIISQGYGSRYVIKEDLIRDWRDFLYLRLLPLSAREYEYWPRCPSSFRETLHEYSLELQKVAQKLLQVFSQNLGLDPSFLQNVLVQPYQKMLINYYPPCPEPELTAGFHKHSDLGAVTLVMQEEGVVGLQVSKDGEWVPVEPVKGAFVVNVGDQVEIVSNGRYKSVEHRAAVNKGKSRVSVAVFYDAAPEAQIAPSKELLGANKEGQHYKEINFDEHEVAFYDYGANGKKTMQSYISAPPPQQYQDDN